MMHDRSIALTRHIETRPAVGRFESSHAILATAGLQSMYFFVSGIIKPIPVKLGRCCESEFCVETFDLIRPGILRTHARNYTSTAQRSTLNRFPGPQHASTALQGAASSPACGLPTCQPGAQETRSVCVYSCTCAHQRLPFSNWTCTAHMTTRAGIMRRCVSD